MAVNDIRWDEIDAPKFYALQAGVFMGIRAALYPNSVVKTHMQIANRNEGILRTYRDIYSRGGLRALWRGFATLSVGYVPAQVLYATSLEVVKSGLASRLEGRVSEARVDWARNFVGGACASTVSQTVIVPVDVVTSRLMVQSREGSVHHYKGGVDAFAQIWRAEGLRGFYRGWAASVLTYAPFSAVWWSTYAGSKRLYYGWAGRTEGSVGVQSPADFALQSAAGVTAATVGVMSTNPLDLVKSRMQTRMGSKAAAEGGVVANLVTLVREEGWLALTRGSSVRIISSLPFSILGIAGYEAIKRLSLRGDAAAAAAAAVEMHASQGQ